MTSSSTRAPRSNAGFWWVFWWLFGAISGLQIQISMLDHHHSWPLVVSYQVLVWSVWIGYSIAIGALVRRVPLLPPRPLPVLLHLGLAIAFALLHVALWVGVELWLKPYDFMNPRAFLPRFQDVTMVQVPLEIILYGLVVLVHHVRAAAERERERERRAAQLETSLAEARLQALRLQIQPHFLFNTLNAISALVRAGRSADAIGMIGGLSELLRYALDRGKGAVVALEDEVAMVERYLGIQRLRFPERLDVSLDIARDAARAAVPVLLLQPLVENGIRHGVERSSGPARVGVIARREGDDLSIQVFNTPGRFHSGPRAEGIGLSSTVSRLAQMFGDRASFELVEQDGGVLARVRLPWTSV